MVKHRQSPQTEGSVNKDVVQKLLTAAAMPLQKVNDQTFFALCAEWKGDQGTVYGYRCWPVIQRKPKYLFVWPVRDASEESLLQQFGSGKYKLILTDVNRPKQLQQVASTVFTISDPEHPPVVDLAELVVEHPENRSYVQGLRARGELKQEEEVPNNDTPMVGLVRDLLSRKPEEPGGSLLTEMYRHQAQLTTTLIGALAKKPEKVESGGMDSSVLIALIKQQSDMTGQMVQMMMAQQKPAAAPPEDDLAKLDKLTAIADRLGNRAGGAWSEFFRVLPDVAFNVTQFVGNLAALKAGKLPVVDPDSDEEAPALTAPGASQEVDVETQRFIGVIQSAGSAVMRGVTGAEFAAALATLDPDAYAMIQGMGRDGVIEKLKSIPEVWTPLAPFEERLTAWLDSFFSRKTRNAA